MANSEQITLLADLVRINSVNPAYQGGGAETEIQRFVQNFFVTHGVSASEQQVLPGRPNVIAKLPGKNPSRRIIFEAHCDTAGVGGMLIPPFDPQIREKRLYGRGSCDTKAGLAAMMLALADLRRASQQPPSEVWVVSAMDEEHSYRGVWELRKNLHAAAAVVSEPTDMKMAVASKGCLRWRITIKGKAAHSSKPFLGINAIEHMGRVIRCLEEESLRLKGIQHPLLGSPTLNVGLIQGGTQVNVVPDSCWIEVDRRLIPGEEPDQVFRGYQELLGKLHSERPSLDLTVNPPQLEDRPLETPATASIALHAAQALREAGLDDGAMGVPFGSDASKLSSVGISSIILGPGSIDQAHTAEEFVELEQVEKAFVVYRQIMRTFE
jgi:acetylornithine deacetylase/succinyl-diaminopimelate desuccinylase family protein